VVEVDDWRKSLIKHLQDPKGAVDRKYDDGLSNLFWMIQSYIVGLQMIYF
jgi:hypothetical protein